METAWLLVMGFIIGIVVMYVVIICWANQLWKRW